MSNPGAETALVAEAEGETVGEAKWAALRELERRFPGLDREAVAFQVLSEGERGLLGVGQVPARVLASVAEAPRPRPEPDDASSAGPSVARVRDLLERLCEAIGIPAGIAVAEDDETVTATLSGPGLGLLIGKHGQTIDAIQYLANAIAQRAGDEKAVVVDAAGYRERRRASLEHTADRAAQRALSSGAPVELEPMSAVERKIVHLHLHGREDVETASEGSEPNRYVVVRPAGGG